ncbi:hypothetical protein [Aggregatilinea lenta]|uniref:hypothetical protein n=1 Tax=Aggregatilinea lenta TaxID=913108 RepID=UPI000E5B8719|nr:hypothetical protein [Aggregatilinea lenta]
MDANKRLGGTILIWVMVTIMLITMMTSSTGAVNGMRGIELFGIVLALAGAATLSTLAIWVGGRDQDAEERQLSKAKRNRPDRIQRLVNDLSDDEVYQLEDLLLREREDAYRTSER